MTTFITDPGTLILLAFSGLFLWYFLNRSYNIDSGRDYPSSGGKEGEKTSPFAVIIVLFIVMVIFNVISENSPFLKK